MTQKQEVIATLKMEIWDIIDEFSLGSEFITDDNLDRYNEIKMELERLILASGDPVEIENLPMIFKPVYNGPVNPMPYRRKSSKQYYKQ